MLFIGVTMYMLQLYPDLVTVLNYTNYDQQSYSYSTGVESENKCNASLHLH